MSQLTKKRVEVISYWCNDKLWKPERKSLARKILGISDDSYCVGSFQRDTEGFDLKTPKLEKGPDLFCDYLIRNRSEIEKNGDIHVVLGGWRRQYIENRLKEESIKYSLFEKSALDKVRLMYAACDLYVVSSRYEGGPQAIIEAASMKIPIVSTDVGIANQVLSDKCVIDITKDYYLPDEKDLEYAHSRVRSLDIKNHGNKFISLFEELK